MRRDYYPDVTPANRANDWRSTLALVIGCFVGVTLLFESYQLVEGIRHWFDPYADPLLPTWFFDALLASPFVLAAFWCFVVYQRWARIESVKADKVIALTRAQRQTFPASLHSLSFHDSSRPIVPDVLSEETQ